MGNSVKDDVLGSGARASHAQLKEGYQLVVFRGLLRRRVKAFPGEADQTGSLANLSRMDRVLTLYHMLALSKGLVKFLDQSKSGFDIASAMSSIDESIDVSDPYAKNIRFCNQNINTINYFINSFKEEFKLAYNHLVDDKLKDESFENIQTALTIIQPKLERYLHSKGTEIIDTFRDCCADHTYRERIFDIIRLHRDSAAIIGSGCISGDLVHRIAEVCMGSADLPSTIVSDVGVKDLPTLPYISPLCTLTR